MEADQVRKNRMDADNRSLFKQMASFKGHD